MVGNRRAVLAAVAGVLTTGCLGEDTNGNGASPTPPSCDPGQVSRPPVVEDSNHPPQGYGRKPAELTEQSVADYLSDFETAFAWNRILDENDDVESLNIDTIDGYTPEGADGGFLASSRIETQFTVAGDDEPRERSYVTNYFVSAEPVYRVETDAESTDPRDHPDRQLVQCGPE